ncbi:mechanosensitive ion channel family protein [Aminipila luticellarii]|uniref:Mechanosensitive ion channel family protein n=1 Tax=Aminipila luticellarii TaxID=2507160 RepID=A0A410PUK7_9FIRM|nr:mechanosensitive ion channel family protein [Aminipila luticellarii]QAT42568.1 mechanosensitive ion channel family protein [Aminipila luticellarii]
MFSERALEKLVSFAASLGEAAVVLIAGYIIIKIVLGIIRRALNKTTLDASLHTFIENSVKVVFWIILTITVLGVLGIPLSTFIAVLGAAGAAIALALKDSLGNIAGGIIILVTKPFKQGDYIDIIEVAGVVEEIDLLCTRLKTADNKVVSVPNGKMTTAVMINSSAEATRRVDCTFGIGYEDDMDKAKELLLAVAEAKPEVFRDPAPFVCVSGHGDNSVLIDLRVWCKTEDYWDIKYFLEENVKVAFDEAGISIPYPQIEVHYKK